MSSNIVTFKITGVQNTIRQIEAIGKAARKQVRKTIQTQLESWLIDAKLLTPVDTGALQESGRLLKPRGRGGSTVFFQIVFGGITKRGKFVNYAAEVHENHPTGSGFLQKVVVARSEQLEKILASDLDSAIKSAAR